MDLIRANIVTIPERIESLEKCVNSLLPDVDEIFVALNGHKTVPSFLNHPKITYQLLDNSLGDAAKMLTLENFNGYVIILDDDLSMRKGNVDYFISKIDEHKGVVSLLGKKYGNRPIESFRKSYTELYRCLGHVAKDAKCDLIGSGACGFHTDIFRPDMNLFSIKRNMADIWLAKQCFQQGIPLWVIAHPIPFVTYSNPDWRIWKDDYDDEYQTEILNSFLK